MRHILALLGDINLMNVTDASVPLALPLVPPVTENVPDSALTLTNCALPNSVLLKKREPPLTTALTPVEARFATTAAAIWSAVDPLAKLSCVVPALPATSSVTASVSADPAFVSVPVDALVTT